MECGGTIQTLFGDVPFLFALVHFILLFHFIPNSIFFLLGLTQRFAVLYLSSKYQQKTDKQHILDNPDTYIGSVEHVDSFVWLLDEQREKIVEKNIQYVPALFKLFDEGIVNCRDHVIRMQQAVNNGQTNSQPVTYIDIAVQEDGTIVMINDGNGIDVAEHPEYKIFLNSSSDICALPPIMTRLKRRLLVERMALDSSLSSFGHLMERLKRSIM